MKKSGHFYTVLAMSKHPKGKIEQADSSSKRRNSYHQFLKRRKNRFERHLAKINPEIPATYGKYSGYEL